MQLIRFWVLLEVMHRYSTFFELFVSMWYPFRRMSLKLNKFRVDRVAYNALCMDNIVPFGNIIWAFPEPSITSDCLDIVVTFTFASTKFQKYFRS